MKRIGFMVMALAAIHAALTPSLVARGGRNQPARPNVLFIFPDQLRAQSLGCMDNAEVITPHIDRLAGGGVLFRQTFANSPVCCLARAGLLTGKYAHRSGMVANGLRLRESETTLTEGLGRTIR